MLDDTDVGTTSNHFYMATQHSFLNFSTLFQNFCSFHVRIHSSHDCFFRRWIRSTFDGVHKIAQTFFVQSKGLRIITRMVLFDGFLDHLDGHI